jgi:hypothetical protein
MDIYTTALSTASNAVKDLAIKTVASCSNENEVFIDIEDINDEYRNLPTDDSQEAKELRELVNQAVTADVKMLHLI